MSITSVIIHLITPSTASLLDNVEEDVFDHPIDSTLLHEFLVDPSNALIVAMMNGRVIGMTTGITYVHPDKPRTLFVNEVGVSSRYQRQGIGKQLVSAVLEWGKSRGCVDAWVSTEVANDAARSLYRSTGGIEDRDLAVVYTYALDARRTT